VRDFLSGASTVTLHISQQALAGMVGATRERVNKLLRLWQRQGMLRLGKRLIDIPDRTAFETLA
jgi:CRP-like cAMP-binding protein